MGVPLFFVICKRGVGVVGRHATISTVCIVFALHISLGTLLLYGFFVPADEQRTVTREVTIYILQRAARSLGVEKVHLKSCQPPTTPV